MGYDLFIIHVKYECNLVHYNPTNQQCFVCNIVQGMLDYYSSHYNKSVVSLHSKLGDKETFENISVAKYLAKRDVYDNDLLAKEDRHKDAYTYNRDLGYKQEYKVTATETKSTINNCILHDVLQADHINSSNRRLY